MSFSITILGSSAAVPTRKRWLSSQLLQCGQSLFLIDCGEGTLLRFEEWGLKTSILHHIFISHLHGDHWHGLLGIINRLELHRRVEPLHLYAPPPLQECLDVALGFYDRHLSYPIIFHPLQDVPIQVIFQNQQLEVEAVQLEHTIPTWGFIFREKPKKTKNNTQNKNDNTLKTNNLQTTASYAYFSDTKYNKQFAHYLTGVHTLYHEATFDESRADKAEQYFHSTAHQAACLAKNAEVQQLLLGHISVRYLKDESPLLHEAKAVFPNSRLVKDGNKYQL